MQIAKIEEITKDRCRVTLDTEESFVLYKGEIRLLKLKPDTALSDDIYRQITTVVLPKRCKLRAMNLLKARPYTEYQLRKKLLEGGYSEETAGIALDYVKSFGYVNDKQYALDFIRQQTENRSKKELYMKLLGKGIDKEILDQAFSETYGSLEDVKEQTYDETAVIVKTLKKRGFSPDMSYEDKQKLLAYFYRRGFEMDSVYKAMDSLKD